MRVMFPPIVHVALETLAFALGGVLYWRSSNSATQPVDRWIRWGVLAGAALGAALGSRCLYLAQYWGALHGQPLSVWLGGKTIVGGLLGAVAGVEVSKRALGWKASTGDGFVLPLLVAIVVGRLGCQLSGVSDLTYGNATALPWAWNYGDGVMRHPTSLYEIAGVLMIAAVLPAAPFLTWPGDRFRALMVGYLALRFGLEFLKPPFGPAAQGVLAPERWGMLSAIQWACLAGLAYYGSDMHRWATQEHGRA